MIVINRAFYSDYSGTERVRRCEQLNYISKRQSRRDDSFSKFPGTNSNLTLGRAGIVGNPGQAMFSL
jgi:hypothetical protein